MDMRFVFICMIVAYLAYELIAILGLVKAIKSYKKICDKRKEDDDL